MGSRGFPSSRAAVFFLFDLSTEGLSDAPGSPCRQASSPVICLLCVQWARDEFEGLFKQPAENVNQYLT